VNAEVLAALLGRRVPGPRPGHHQGGAGRRAVAQRGEHPDVQGVTRAEVVAADDDELVVGPVAEALDERRPVVVRHTPTLSVALGTAPGAPPGAPQVTATKGTQPTARDERAAPRRWLTR
jgi:hypothetical protein